MVMMLLRRASPAVVLALLSSTLPAALCAPLAERAEGSGCLSVKESFSVWPNAEAGTQVFGKCWSQEYTGNPSRECRADGTWGPIQNPCTLNTQVCPPLPYASFSIYPQTPINTLAQGSCIDGFTGNPTRFCNADGTWGPENGSCERITCQEETLSGNTWPETPADGLASLACPAGTEGTLFRTCDSNGQWLGVEGSCSAPQQTLMCPEQVYGTATFPATPAGEVATGVCKAGWTGAPRRICNPDGKWQTLVQKHCRLELRVCGNTAGSPAVV